MLDGYAINDQALFDAALAKLEEKHNGFPEPEPEPEPAVVEEEKLEPEPVQEPEPEPDLEEECFCTQFSYGQPNGYCSWEWTPQCHGCRSYPREKWLVTDAEQWEWSEYDCRNFLEKLGFAIPDYEPINVMQEKVKNILEVIKLVALATTVKKGL
jgi:hypothetical protein